MKEYFAEKETVLREYNSSENGLTADEAKSRLDTNGKNKLAQGKRKLCFTNF